jgi:hypothetical protein
MFTSGKDVVGRITNAALNVTPGEIVFKDPNGVVHTFAAGERLIFSNVTGNNRATAKDLTIFQDADAGVDLDAGEEICVMSFAAAGPQQLVFDDEGEIPSRPINAAGTNKFYAFASAAGAVDVLVKGRVVRD